MGGGAVLRLGIGRLLFDALEHLGQGGLVHGEQPFGADAFQQAGDGRVIEYEPIVFGGDVDIAEADLLGGELEFCSAMRTLALLNQALLVKQQKTAANHHCALGKSFSDCR